MNDETLLFAQMVKTHLNDDLDERNKENLSMWYAHKYMIEQGLARPPPDPRTPELRTRGHHLVWLRQGVLKRPSSIFKI